MLAPRFSRSALPTQADKASRMAGAGPAGGGDWPRRPCCAQNRYTGLDPAGISASVRCFDKPIYFDVCS